MKRIAGDIATLAFIAALVFGGYHLLVNVSEAGSWFTFIHFQDGMTTGEWLESLRYKGGCS